MGSRSTLRYLTREFGRDGGWDDAEHDELLELAEEMRNLLDADGSTAPGDAQSASSGAGQSVSAVWGPVDPRASALRTAAESARTAGSARGALCKELHRLCDESQESRARSQGQIAFKSLLERVEVLVRQSAGDAAGAKAVDADMMAALLGEAAGTPGSGAGVAGGESISLLPIGPGKLTPGDCAIVHCISEACQSSPGSAPLLESHPEVQDWVRRALLFLREQRAADTERYLEAIGASDSGSAEPSAGEGVPPGVAAAARSGDLVLVTGAGGFIGSHVVQQLLVGGHAVRGTVRDPRKEDRTAHLRAMQGASDRLQLHPLDLLEAGSFAPAMEGCGVVMHVASPFALGEVRDPDRDMLLPAVMGTLHALRAAASSPTVRRVVVTSSTAAVYMSKRRGDEWCDECEWSDSAALRQDGKWYALSKTLAEAAAWAFVGLAGSRGVPEDALRQVGALLEAAGSEARGGLDAGLLQSGSSRPEACLSSSLRPGGAPPLQVTCLCPTLVAGPLLQPPRAGGSRPGLNESSARVAVFMQADLVTGAGHAGAGAEAGARVRVRPRKAAIPDSTKCFVDVRDVARAHVLAGLGASAGNERVLLIGAVAAWRHVVRMLREGLSVTVSGVGSEGTGPRSVEDGPEEVLAVMPKAVEGQAGDGSLPEVAPYPQAIASIRSASRLGLAYTPLETTMADTVQSLVAGGHIGVVGEVVATA